MSISTIAAGIVIAAVAVLIEMSDKEYEEKKREFENS
jgi:hypothetical protein